MGMGDWIMRQQVLWHVGARREARALPCQMLSGGGSGGKLWINFLPAISHRGQTGRLPFCHPVIDIKSSFCSQGRMDGWCLKEHSQGGRSGVRITHRHKKHRQMKGPLCSLNPSTSLYRGGNWGTERGSLSYNTQQNRAGLEGNRLASPSLTFQKSLDFPAATKDILLNSINPKPNFLDF